MALVVYDRVQQTGSANTTVSFTLSGSVTGYQSFSVIGNGNTTYYAATDASGNWEVGVGTYSTTGPTLTRTTIISSSNSGSAVTFSGTVNVFVTYPAEDAVYLNASGNVSPLGTVSSGTWQGSTVAVAYGGTGTTTSASNSASSLVLRDANVNIAANNVFQGFSSTASSTATSVLTVASPYYNRYTGTAAQTVQFPNATTLPVGIAFIIDNDTTQTLTLTDNSSTQIDTIPSGGVDFIVLLANGTSAGTWIGYSLLPDAFDFGTNTASFNNAPITNAVWNGSTVGVTYGGTGLNSISTSNYAIYSSAANTLTAGTLPILAGGTGLSSYGTSGYFLQSTGTALQYVTAPTTSPAGSNTQVQYNNSGAFGATAAFTYTASTGALVAPEHVASNGLMVNSQTVTTSYSIPSAYSAMSAGPVAVASSVSVTIPAGSRWVIL